MVAHIALNAMQIIIVMSLALLFAIVLVGFLINFLMTLLQVQEQSVPTAVKIMTSIIMTMILFPWLGRILSSYVIDIFDNISKP